MNLVERVKNILFNPSKTWIEIKEEQTTIKKLYLEYVMILALIPTIALFIGLTFDPLGVLVRTVLIISVMKVLALSIWNFVSDLIIVYIIALITNALAPLFNSEKNLTNAFKAVVFSFTPIWIAGIIYIIPFLSFLIFLAVIYALYLFYLGLPLLMNTPKEKALGYVILVVIVSIILYAVNDYIISALFISKSFPIEKIK